MNPYRKETIRSRLFRKQYLHLVTDDLYGISERIRELEDGFFIVRNVLTGKYEVHSLDNIGGTRCFVVPYETLDARTIDMTRESLIATRGDAIMREIEEHNKALDAKKERDTKNYIQDASLELADRTSYALDEDMLHTGYKKTHLVNAAI